MENLNQVISPGFPHNMTFDQGCEEVRERTREYLGDRAFQADGTASANKVSRHDPIGKGSELKQAYSPG